MIASSVLPASNGHPKGPTPGELARALTGKDYLSHSQVRLFQSCSLKWYFTYMLKAQPESVSAALVLGSADRYRDRQALAAHLDGMVNPDELPSQPFVGTITWTDIGQVLMERFDRMTPAEQSIAVELDRYIQHKMNLPRQSGLPVMPTPSDHMSSAPLVTLPA